MKNYMDEYNAWANRSDMDEALKTELNAIRDDVCAIEDRFYTALNFGTAGLRGVLGAGINRMNIYVVRQASAGLARYLLDVFGDECKSRGVAIAYDSRHKSDEFALQTALVLAKYGIRAYLFDSLRSVPQLSFTVRHLNCVAGVVITASHNPPEYNGYKVYWEDGGQLPPERCDGVMAALSNIKPFDVELLDEASAKAAGLLEIIGEQVDEAYYAATSSLRLHPDIPKEQMERVRVVYTPLHGSGAIPVQTILNRMGIALATVAQQEKPNPNFPTVKAPNPEDPAAFLLAAQLAYEFDADIILATDPDSDRLGVGIKTNSGNYQILSGNQIGALLIHYILLSRTNENNLPKDSVVIKSIVSTRMANAICARYNVTLEEVLTGFRFISEKIETYSKTNEKTFLFGFEESYGFLAGGFSRDKDAICAAMLLTECCAYFCQQNKSLSDVLDDMYRMYGCYKEGVKSYTLKGKDGLERIALTMTDLRENPPSTIAGLPVCGFEDIKTGVALSFNEDKSKTVSPISLPKSDVLRLTMPDDAWVCIRPSGTEPKLKLYAGVRAANQQEAAALCEKLLDAIDSRLKTTLQTD